MSKGRPDDWAPLASVGKTVEFAFSFFNRVVAQEAGAERVPVVQRVRAVELHAVRREVVVNIPGEPLEEQVLRVVGPERDLPVPRERRRPGTRACPPSSGTPGRCNTPARSGSR